MHSLSTKNGTRFHFNGDFSGNILITVPKEKVEPADEDRVFVEVPFNDVKEFVIEHLRNEFIAQLEEMPPEKMAASITLTLNV